MNTTNALPHKAASPRRGLKKALTWAAAGLAAVVVIVYLVIGGIAANQLTVPDRDFDESLTPSAAGLAYEEVQFQASDGAATIAAWYVPSTDNRRAVILVHGRNASRTAMFLGESPRLIRAINQAGFSVLAIDLRGHGQSSEARFTFGVRERYDVIGAVDWLVARGYQPGEIGVIGISLGSSAAVGAAADDSRIGALISDSGFAEIFPVIQSRWVEESGLPQVFLVSTRLMIWVLYGYDIAAARPVAEIGKAASRPVMLFHCANDVEIPYAHVQQLQAAAQGAELWTIPACEHGQSYNADPAGYEKHLVDFFRASLP